FDIHDGGDKFRQVVGWVVFVLRPQPTGDTIISTLGQQPGHLFECGFHAGDIANLGTVCNRQNSTATRFGRSHGPSQRATSSSEYGTRTMCPPRAAYRETRNPSVATTRNSKTPVVSAPPTATFGGKISATAPQTPLETNIQTVSPARRKPAVGFGPGLAGE